MRGLSTVLGPEPAQELRLPKEKKKRHFVNPSSRSLLTSPLEGAPAALTACHTAHPPSSCSAPSLLLRNIKG